ncbi:alpha-2-macroglobulin-like, partial [Notothenia coriiceps]|uniref:Alpha-2-macroglobulin-like n=1 Tax=Notothenia coriiceps TaxID=8208 RepID=A0A6I9PJN1_9TELE
MRPANQMYNIIGIEDANRNRIGQWLNETSDSILQLSFALNSEAREGSYKVSVSTGSNKVYHSFKVEKYVLPKFDVKITASDKVSIDREEIKAEVCATYTYGQPVPGSVNVEMCRPFKQFVIFTLDNPEGIYAPCYKETKQTDKKGCATFIFPMSTFTKVAQKFLLDKLKLTAQMEEEGTGISHQQEKRMDISYVVGKLSFTDTPKIYDQGSVVEGKVKAVYYNNTPIADMPVYLFMVERWSARLIQNLTTDSNGVAPFSFSTVNVNGNIRIQLSLTPALVHHHHRTPYYEAGHHTVSLAQVSSPDTKTVSFLEVKKKDKPLPCEKEEEIFIQYTVVGEAQGSVDMMYL